MNILNNYVRNPVYLLTSLVFGYLIYRLVQYCTGNKPKAKETLNNIQHAYTPAALQSRAIGNSEETGKAQYGVMLNTNVEEKNTTILLENTFQQARTSPVFQGQEIENFKEIAKDQPVVVSKKDLIEDITKKVDEMRKSIQPILNGNSTSEENINVFIELFDQLSHEDPNISGWANTLIGVMLTKCRVVQDPKLVQAVLDKCNSLLNAIGSLDWKEVQGIAQTPKSNLQTIAINFLAEIVLFGKIENPKILNDLLINLIETSGNTTPEGLRTIVKILEFFDWSNNRNLHTETVKKAVIFLMRILTEKSICLSTAQLNTTNRLIAASNPKIPFVKIPGSNRHPEGWDALTILSQIYNSPFYSESVSDYKNDAAEACKDYLDRAKKESLNSKEDNLIILYNAVNRWALPDESKNNL